MTRRSVAGLLAVDFFTMEYRISGHIDNRFKTVGDILNDRLESYAELTQVFISRISSPADIIGTYADAQLRKDNLLFAIVPAKERLSKVGRATSYFGTQTRHVWLALPTFEVEGGFQVTGISLDWKAYLAKGISDFVPILDGVARVAALPQITFTGEALLVNRLHIDLFCMEDEPS